MLTLIYLVFQFAAPAPMRLCVLHQWLFFFFASSSCIAGSPSRHLVWLGSTTPPSTPLSQQRSSCCILFFFSQVTSLCWQHMCPTSHQHTLMGLFVCTGKTSFSYRLLVSFLGIFCTRKKCHYHRRFFKYPLLWWCLIVNWTTSRFNQRLN